MPTSFFELVDRVEAEEAKQPKFADLLNRLNLDVPLDLRGPEPAGPPYEQSDKEQRQQIIEASGGTPWYAYPGEAMLGVARGATRGTGMAMSGLSRILTDVVGLDPDVITGTLLEAGQSVQNAASGIPVDPSMEGGWTQAIGEAAGTTLPAMAAATATGPVGLGVFGASTGYESTYNNVKALGGTDEEARSYAKFSAAVTGVTEPFLGVAKNFKLFRRANQATDGWIAKTLLTAGEEAGEEILQEIPDETARHAYIKERGLWDTVKTLAETGAIGGTVGLLLGGIVNAPAFVKAMKGSKSLEAIQEKTGELGLTEGPPLEQAEAEALAKQLGGVLSEGQLKLIEDYDSRKSSGQKDPVPTKQAFTEAGYEDGGGTRKERAAIAQKLVEVRDAQAVRGDQGQVQEAGVLGQGGEVQGGENLYRQAQEQISGGQTAETRLKTLTKSPLHSVNPLVAQAIQSEAKHQLETRNQGLRGNRIKSAKTREALAKIVADEGQDVGSEVARQKKRLLEHLLAKKDFRTIFERDIGAPEQEPDAIVSAYLSGASDQEIEQIGKRLGLVDDDSFDFGGVTNVQANQEAQAQAAPEAVLGQVPPTPRPDLANPGISPEARAMMDQVDAIRNQTGRPGVLPDSQAERMAQERLAANREAERQRLLSGDFVPSENGVDTLVARTIFEEEAIAAARSNDPAAIADAIAIGDAYRTGRTSIAREMRQGRDRVMSPAQRMAFSGAQAIIEPPPKVKRAISRAKKTEAKQQRKSAAPSSRRTAKARKELDDAWKEFTVKAAGTLYSNPVEAIPAAVRLAKAYVKLGVANFQDFMSSVAERIGQENAEKARTNLEQAWQAAISEERKETKAERKSRKLAEEWAKNVEPLKAKLRGMGHDIDSVLAGTADPRVAAAAIRDAGALKAPFGDKVYEFWQNAILSGPQTNIVNFTGGSANAAWNLTAERLTKAIVDSIARVAGIRSDGARLGELKYIYTGFMENWGKAAANFFETWKTEIPQFQTGRGAEATAPFEIRTPSISGKKGRVVRVPWRTLSAADDFVKTMVAATETNMLAYRQATNEGLKGKDRQDRIVELVNDQQWEGYQEATESTVELAFQKPSKFGETIRELREEIPGARYVLPFITTPFNIVKSGLRRTPLGSLKLAKEIYSASRSGDWSQVSQRTAEQVLAWSAVLALAYLNDPDDPWITGGTDHNRKYSIKIGGRWFYYGRIEPFATTLGLIVDGLAKIRKGGDLVESLLAPIDALLDRIDIQTFFTGLSDFIKAARYGDASYVLNWAAKFPASFVPNLIRSEVRAAKQDVPERRVWAKGEERLKRIGVRGLQATEFVQDFPKYDLWGRAIPRDGSPLPNTDWLWNTLVPFGQKNYQDTLGDRIIARWNARHPNDPVEFRAPMPYYTVDGKTIYMSDEEYADFQRRAGEMALKRVIEANKTNPFNVDDPTEANIKRLRGIIDSSRDSARRTLKQKSAA